MANGAQVAPAVDNSLEARLAAVEPLPPRPADIVRTIALGGGMKPYAWSMNGEYWPQVTPLMLVKGQRVEIDLVNRTMMAHPIHLHGHAFQVIAVDGRPILGAIRDTVLLTPMGLIDGQDTLCLTIGVHRSGSTPHQVFTPLSRAGTAQRGHDDRAPRAHPVAGIASDPAISPTEWVRDRMAR